MKDQKHPAGTTQSERPDFERKLPYTPPLLQEYGRLSEFVQTSSGVTNETAAGSSFTM